MAYCTHIEVSYALRGLFPSVSGTPTGFTASTTPTVTEVTTLIDLTDAEIDMALAEIGFKLPITARTGETIPTQQTNWLKLMSILGTAAKVVDAMRPAPAMGPEARTPQGNVYASRFNALMNQLRQTAGFGLRALTWAGRRAGNKLATTRAPMSSFREGVEGAGDSMGLWDYTLELARNWNLEAQDEESWNWDAIIGWQSF